LSPGRYCGGITVGGSATVTLSAGTYYMDLGYGASPLTGIVGTGLSVASGGSVNGNGVTIVVTSSGSGLLSIGSLVNLDFGNLFGGGVINLKAPPPGLSSPGVYPELVYFVDPAASLSITTFKGGTQNSFVGTIYSPAQGSQLIYAGGSGTKTGQCTRLIADEITFLGGASFSTCFQTLGPSPSTPAALLE
jgi:hypothetical protein